jgi:hypothetical protein
MKRSYNKADQSYLGYNKGKEKFPTLPKNVGKKARSPERTSKNLRTVIF